MKRVDLTGEPASKAALGAGGGGERRRSLWTGSDASVFLTLRDLSGDPVSTTTFGAGGGGDRRRSLEARLDFEGSPLVALYTGC